MIDFRLRVFLETSIQAGLPGTFWGFKKIASHDGFPVEAVPLHSISYKISLKVKLTC